MAKFKNLRLLGSWMRAPFSDGTGRTRLYGKFFEIGVPAVHYEWTPHWNDTAKLLVEAVEIERLNEPDPGPGRYRHRFLEQFAKVAREIIVMYADFQSVSIVDGEVRRIEKLGDALRIDILIRDSNDSVQSYDLLVSLTHAQLRHVPGKRYSYLLWNDQIVEIKGLPTDEEIANSTYRY